MSAYFAILGSPTLTVVRYEDYIFDKAALIALIASRFGWQAEGRLTEQILRPDDRRDGADGVDGPPVDGPHDIALLDARLRAGAVPAPVPRSPAGSRRSSVSRRP